MDALTNATIRPVTTAPKVDDAVGVPKKYWFVAIVNNKSERQCAKKLGKLGFECYVPTQEEIHIWRTGVKKIVDRIIIPSIVLIHTTEAERKQCIVTLPYINRFMTNRARKKDDFGKHPVAIIPDDQVMQLKFMLGHADAPVEFESTWFKLGDKVRIIRGGLTGLVGNVHRKQIGKSYVVVKIDCLGFASVEVPLENIEIML